MNLVLWLIAGLLAAVFGATGILTLLMSKETLVRSGITWVEHFGTATVKVIGALELLAALALLLPAALGTATWLTPVAALGLVVLMGGAVLHNLRHHELRLAAGNGLLLVLAAILAWGRFGPYPL
jgi:hypothetical protein